MRAYAIPAIATALLAALAASNAAIEVPGRGPDGWGSFKFGMNPQQVRLVPGLSWRPGAKAPSAIVSVTVMNSLPMTSEYGPDTQVTLGFNPDEKLQSIQLSRKDTQSAADCEKAYRTLLTRLDAKYGPFAPGDEKAQWIDLNTIIRGGILERTSALALPGSRSRYWHRTVLPNVSGLNLEAEAKHAAGARSVELMMYQKDGKDGCVRTIAFSAPIPSKAQLDAQYKLKHVPTDMDWHWAEVDRLAGFSSGSGRPVFSTGAADHVRLAGGRFAADMTRPPGSPHPGIMHLVGTIADNKISAHIAESGATSDDFPTNFEGEVSMFATDGEPVDTYEISLTGKTRSGSTSLGMAAYHRSSPHTPTPQACKATTDSMFATQRTPREMTYRGLLQALGCPPP